MVLSLLDVFIAGIMYGLLILAHNGTALMFSPVILLYCLFRMKNKYNLMSFFVFFLIGIFVSSYFWLPAIVESRYVNSTSAFGDMYRQHFPPFLYLIYSMWGFGPDVNAQNGLSPQIGIILFIFIIIAIIHFFRDRERFVGFWLLIFFAAIFFTTSLSDVFWSKIVPLRFLEFPWRFTALSSLSGAVVGSYVMSKTKNKKIIYYLSILLLIAGFFYTKTDVQNKRDDKYYYSFLGSTVYRRATTTIWTGGDPFSVPENKISVISGSGQLNNLKIKSNRHSFSIDAETNVRVLDNTFYFPGWKAEIDGKKVPVEFQDMNHRGLITFSVPKGVHSIEVIFKESAIRLFADMVSLFSIIAIFLFFVFRFCFSFVRKR